MYNSNLGLQGCCFSKKKSLVKKNHVNVWQKPLQYCKAISLQLIKINEKKKPCTSCVYVFFFFITQLPSLIKTESWFKRIQGMTDLG